MHREFGTDTQPEVPRIHQGARFLAEVSDRMLVAPTEDEGRGCGQRVGRVADCVATFAWTNLTVLVEVGLPVDVAFPISPEL
jgi:hypothetical protein